MNNLGVYLMIAGLSYSITVFSMFILGLLSGAKRWFG